MIVRSAVGPGMDGATTIGFGGVPGLIKVTGRSMTAPVIGSRSGSSVAVARLNVICTNVGHKRVGRTSESATFPQTMTPPL
jgi:hypothetical protein